MYTLIIIFYVSILAMLTMVLLKRRETKTGKQSLVSRLGKGTDHVFHFIFSAGRKGVSYLNRKTFMAIMHWIAYHTLYSIRKVYVELKHRALADPYGKKLIDAVRGRGEIRDHGASFYLRRISDK